jgi:two-component system, chemotaxis family, chemotaxis protein CheY
MKTILVVDDSPTIRRMIKASLAGAGPAAIVEAASGLEALERISLGPVDLVLLDMNMPDMHGLEVLRFLRAQPTLKSVPVVILTTKQDDTTRNDCLSAGASLFLTKPFDPKVLAQHARDLLTSDVSSS